MAKFGILTAQILLTASDFDSRKSTNYAKGVIDQGNQKRHDELVELIDSAIKEKLATKTIFAELKLLIKDIAGLYVYRHTKRHPIIIPVIMSKN